LENSRKYLKLRLTLRAGKTKLDAKPSAVTLQCALACSGVIVGPVVSVALAHSAQIQRVLAIPSKRYTRTLVRFLSRPEVDALLAAPDPRTWFGRRDHAFLLLAVQTGLRLSEMTGLKRGDVTLGTGAHVRVIGKGRKERCTPLAKSTVAALKA
jgi:integrase